MDNESNPEGAQKASLKSEAFFVPVAQLNRVSRPYGAGKFQV
jgi:hypothetical protein